jgi:N-acetylmuramoyl-L-alanine amidase
VWTVVVFCIVGFCHRGLGATKVSDENISAEFGLQRKLALGPEKAVLGSKLWNDQHEVLLFADMRYVMVDGELVSLEEKVTASSEGLEVPRALLRMLRARLPRVNPPEKDETESYTVVLDPGHGGQDPGAVGTRGTLEKDVNLQVSLLLAQLLADEGVTVLMTRKTDTALSLERRVQVANGAGCDLFISIHSNSAGGDRRTQGYMVLFPADEWQDTSKGNIAERARDAVREGGVVLKNVDVQCPSARAKTIIYGALLEEYRRQSYQAATEIRKALHKAVETPDLGNRNDPRGLRVLRKTYCPAVLVELDFLSSPAGEARLASRRFQKLMATGLAEGVLEFLRKSNGKSP